MLLVVHDLALAAAVADTVVVMSEGRTVAAGAAGRGARAPSGSREVWDVDAALDAGAHGQTALRVAWLGDKDTTGGSP